MLNQSDTKNHFTESLARSLFLIFIASMLFLSFLPEDKYSFLMREDGPAENGTVIACFLGAYFCIKSFLLRKRLFSKISPFFLFGALLFVFAGGEEMDWGQRIFAFKTVDQLKAVNYQGGFNIHNIKNIDDIVYLGGFGAIITILGIFPLFSYVLRWFRNIYIRLSIPLMPKSVCLSAWLGFFILLLYPQLRYHPDNLLGMLKIFEIQELREFYFCFIVFAYVFAEYFYLLKYKSIFNFERHD